MLPLINQTWADLFKPKPPPLELGQVHTRGKTKVGRIFMDETKVDHIKIIW